MLSNVNKPNVNNHNVISIHNVDKDNDVDFIKSIVRDSRITQFKDYIHIKQYRNINDDHEPILIVTPKLEQSYDLTHHTTQYWYMDIFPYLEKGKTFHKVIKKLEANNKRFIQENFGDDIEYRSCLVNKKKIHPRMSLSLPKRNNQYSFKTFINHTETIPFTDIKKEDNVTMVIRMKDLYVNKKAKTAGCNWELIQVKVSRLEMSHCLLQDESAENHLQHHQQHHPQSIHCAQGFQSPQSPIEQLLHLLQRSTPAIVMNASTTSNTNVVNHANHLHSHDSASVTLSSAPSSVYPSSSLSSFPSSSPSLAQNAPVVKRGRSSERTLTSKTSKNTTMHSKPVMMIPQLNDILSIKNNLRSVNDRPPRQQRDPKPMRSFPTPQDLIEQRKNIETLTDKKTAKKKSKTPK